MKARSESIVISMLLAGCGGPLPSEVEPTIERSQALLSSLSQPSAIAIDGDGNPLVADRGQHVLAAIHPASSCALTVVAGTPGVAGYADGPGQIAQFNTPNGVALDPTGNVYIADHLNHKIRKMTSSGIVNTFAGVPYTTEDVSFAGGKVCLSYVTGPGTSYIDTILYYDPITAVSTWEGAFGGTYPAPGRTVAAPINLPGSNLFYAAVSTQNKIVGGNPMPAALQFAAGTGAVGHQDGPIAQATFSTPAHIAAGPAGTMYVSDTGNHAIRQITNNLSTVAPLAGSYGNPGNVDGPAYGARFNAPEGLAVASDGAIYVADTGNGVIRRISADGQVRTLVYGQSSCGVCPSGQNLCATGCSPLDDNNNCGACGHICGAGSACVSGVCAGPATITGEMMTAGAIHLTFVGAPNVSYKVQASSDLSSWSDLGSAKTDSSGVGSFVDNDASKYQARFYRIVL